MASEKSITEAIKKLLKRRGAWVVKFHGGKATRAGVPDLLCCYRGRFLAIEVKQPGKKATPIQNHEMQLIVEAGGVSIVASSTEDVEKTLDWMDEGISTGVR